MRLTSHFRIWVQPYSWASDSSADLLTPRIQSVPVSSSDFGSESHIGGGGVDGVDGPAWNEVVSRFSEVKSQTLVGKSG